MSENLFDLTGEVAVVIGATGVLGGALAEGLAAAGAKVAVLGRNAERGEARVAAIREAGNAAAYFGADAMDPISLREAHQAVATSLGAPTFLLIAAGFFVFSDTATTENPFQSIALEQWRANFDLNL